MVHQDVVEVVDGLRHGGQLLWHCRAQQHQWQVYKRATIVDYATRVIILWLEVTKFNYWKYVVDVMVFAPYSYFYSLDIYFHLKHNKVQLKSNKNKIQVL